VQHIDNSNLQDYVESTAQRTTNDLTSNIKRFGFLPALHTRLRNLCLEIRRLYLVHCWGMDIHPYTLISLEAKLDKTHPRGIHIGKGTNIAFGAAILSHDLTRRQHKHTYVGKFCSVGARSIILPGVKIGNHSIVGAGAVVTKDVAPHTIVAGNPARVIRQNIQTERWGKLVDPGQKPLPDMKVS
jgi:acetyltransferase-like isoleucine patch superfamily enzyme